MLQFCVMIEILKNISVPFVVAQRKAVQKLGRLGVGIANWAYICNFACRAIISGMCAFWPGRANETSHSVVHW